MSLKIGGLCAVLLFALAAVGAGLAQVGGGYDLSWHLVSSGGGRTAGGRYTLSGSAGQPEAGVLAGEGYTLRAGFWQSFAPATGTPTPTATSTATATNSPTATHTPTPTATAIPAERIYLPLVLRNYGDHSETRSPGLGSQGASSSATAAALLVVNTTDDTDDGTCDAGHCSLREAVNLARPGDTIAFNIPPSDPGYDATVGVWTVRPAARYGLPGGVTLDGTTQTANRGDTNPFGPEIEVDGSGHTSDFQCFRLRSDANVLRGLVINRCGSDGLWVEGRFNVVAGNYIGTDATGTQARPVSGHGIFVVRAQDNTIGGDTPAERNVISGNKSSGIHISDASSQGNRVIGNYIGTDRTGTLALANESVGITVNGAQGNTIGPGNVISGNRWGVWMTADASGNAVLDNYVGTDAGGTGRLGNNGLGVVVGDGAQGNLIGPGNVIAYNSRDGVWIEQPDSVRNTITRNSIHSNGGLGINNVDGGNLELAPPVIAMISGGQASGTACPGCTVEIFSDFEDEGRTFEGTTVADAAGNWSLDVSPAGPNVTATATDEAGNTSEFSAPAPIAGTPTPTPTSTPTGTPSPTPTVSPTRTPTPTATVGAPAALVVNTTDDADDGICDAGHCSLREAINAANRYAGPATVAFDIPPSDPGYSATPGVWTIRPARLYFLRTGVTIDGTTQTANRGDTNPQGPEVEIDGSGHTPAGFDCFELTGDNVLRGLVINRCTNDGVRVTGSGSSVAGNYIGTDPTGTLARPVQGTGVRLDQAQSNTIGGPTPADRNVISGNRWGVFIATGSSGNTIRNNYVGTDARGTAPLGNTRLGVLLSYGAQANQLGPGNVIAHNEEDGVSVEDTDSVGNTITRNAIHSNGGLGINNVDGGNLELAPPVIAMISGGQVSGTACPGCTVEIFSDFEDEGRTFEGATVADAAGHWSLDVSPAGPNVTATATDGAGNTSEFSLPAAVGRRWIYLPLVMR